MAKIRKIYDQTIKPDGSKTTIYPITSTRAVYTPEGETLDSYLKDGYFHGADLRGYKTVSNVTDLPTTENQFGWLIGEDLYVWVGTGGDTLGGLYQNCGHFRTPYVPDDEDLVADSDNELKLKDRTVEDGGMGYVILRKNKSFAEQVTETNTIYEIRYNFDLGGTSVTIPGNCVLKFDGGSIGNGTISGNDTRIAGDNLSGIFNAVTISGTWNVPKINSRMFVSLQENNAIRQVFNLSSEEYHNDITIEKEEYDYVFSFTANNQRGIDIKSNTDIHLLGTISVAPNAFKGYWTVCAILKSNISIDGGGKIHGDLDDHTFEETATMCHGFFASGSKKIRVSNIEIEKFPTDGISIVNADGNNSFNDTHIKNVKIHDCLRQGISIIQNGVIVEGCEIYNIGGSSPECGIDIEPNNTTDTCSKIRIFNNYFHECDCGVQTVSTGGPVTGVIIENNHFKDNKTAIRNSGTTTRLIRIENNYIESSVVGGNGISYPNGVSCYIVNNTINVPNLAFYLNPNSVGRYYVSNNIVSGAQSVFYNNTTLNNNIFYNIDESEEVNLIGLYGSRIEFTNNTVNGRFRCEASDCLMQNNNIVFLAGYGKYCWIAANRVVFSNNTISTQDNENVGYTSELVLIAGNSVDFRKNKIELFGEARATTGIHIGEGEYNVLLQYNDVIGSFTSGQALDNDSTGVVVIDEWE